MTIAFVHNNKAFLPEMEAYSRFFSAYDIQCEMVNKADVGGVQRQVEWWMMGTDITKRTNGIFKIHEYCSTSVPPFSWWKNRGKHFFNTRPHFRLFLNDYVRHAFGFHDNIPFGYRDMGLPETWLITPPVRPEPEFDFIYTGNLAPVRRPELLLNCFSTGAMKDRTLLLIGKDYSLLQAAYASYKNIVFMGPVPYHAMSAYILKARFGINYMVDREPFNQQTSTKLLEYAALGVPVISTQYTWVEAFQQRYGGNFFYLEPDLSNFTWERVNHFPYATPHLEELTWEKQIRNSGVLGFLEAKFPELKF
jgi:glycosyltransferase involved in cell wall biosynthesis